MRFGRDRRYSRNVRVKKCGNGNTVTGKRIVYSRREDGEIGIFGRDRRYSRVMRERMVREE